MGAGQSDLYKGTYGDSIGNIPSKVSGISMPNHQNAITPKEKFINYSLNSNNTNAKAKAEAYERALGFNRNNAQELIRKIEGAVKKRKRKPY